jgi:S-methylmethionine-dependent homocysteine/selenocysteine methylase
MKINKKRLVEIIEEECAMAQEPQMPEMDNEGEFAKRQLHDMEQYSRELAEMLTDTTQLESWVQAKLTKAADYLKTVKHYVEYGMEEGAYDQVSAEIGSIDPVGANYNDPQSGNYDIEDEMTVKMLEKLIKP